MTEVNEYSENMVDVANIDAQNCVGDNESLDVGVVGGGTHSVDGEGDVALEGDSVSLGDDENDDEDMPLVPKIEKEVGFIISGLRKISSGFVSIVHGVERIVRAILRAVKKIF